MHLDNGNARLHLSGVDINFTFFGEAIFYENLGAPFF